MTIQSYTIDNLLAKWKERLKANSYYEMDEYSIALSECIHDLQEAIGVNVAEEECFNDMLKNLPSDDFKYDLLGEIADKECLATVI